MYAVGKLGSYISRGVVTVAAPFHPFGGAVDIVVVKQEDGSFKSSPWHIQFGKFQGVLKAREKVVTLNINGVDADFKMYLDSKGGAYFVREVDAEDGVSETASSGEDSLGSSNTSSQQELKLVSESEAANGKVVAQHNSTGPRILGYVFGRRSEKESSSQQQEASIARDTTASLERAEIAADLLEVRWSTSLATRKQKKESGSSISDQEYSVNGDGQTDSPLLAHSNASTDSSPHSDRMNDAGDTLPPLFTSPTTCMKSKHFEVNGGSESSICDVGNGNAAYRSESIGSNSFVERLEELKSGAASPTIFQVLQADDGSRIEIFKPAIDSETSGSLMEDVDSFNGTSSESSPFKYLVSGTIDDPELASELNSEYSATVLTCQMDTNTEKLEDKEPCVSVHGSNSGFVTPDEVETVLQTKVEIILGCKTNKGPVKLVDELVVDQIAPNQAPILKNSFLIEEATTAALHLMEDLRSQERCSFPPSDSLVTSGVVLHDSEDERCISSDLESSGDKKVYGLAEELIEAQDSTPLDSPKPEDTSQSYPDSIKEKFHESTDMLKSSTSELIQDSSPNDDSSCHDFSRTLSTPISIIGSHEQVDQAWSHGVENNSQDINHTMSVPSDSSFASTKYVPVDVSTNEQQLAPTKSSLEHDKMSEELKELLSDPAVEISLCSHLLHEGMGYEAAAHVFDSEQLDVDKLVSLGPDCLKNDKLVVRIGGLYFPWKEALSIIAAIGSPKEEEILEPKGMINVEEGEYAVETSPQHATESSNGTWRLWPFTKAKSMNKRNSVTLNNTSESKTVKKKIVRAKTPTSEQLASLNLKEGKNTVLFTFSTSMLGEQKVDAHIYLWKWNDRIVISDVDGTITKSDVLGQFMPMVGYDWSQTGVTHLFSAIKENGYKLLFLSARAISQASVTRQFLFNLKQEGKALPEGPVVISPDGLFPSLFREVIRRAPHEFKIACLEDIKSLFPPDTNPFYAGFGNRDTDIVSYVKVGIPKGKVYIINPKGEVAVHRCVATKSYSSLHELVNEMFPESSAISLSEKEDFNTWNFWRMPPPETLS